MSGLIRKPMFIAIAAVVLLLIGAMLVNALTGGAVAKALARLSGNQTEAALRSGRDAVASASAQAAAEDRVDAITEENEDAIRNAEGADAPVAAPVGEAGLGALCRRAAYRDHPRCVRPGAADRRGE